VRFRARVWFSIALECYRADSQLVRSVFGSNRWSLWPSTLARDAALRLIGIEHMKPTAHTFYGPWRAFNVNDELEKWVGNEGKSERVG